MVKWGAQLLYVHFDKSVLLLLVNELLKWMRMHLLRHYMLLRRLLTTERFTKSCICVPFLKFNCI